MEILKYATILLLSTCLLLFVDRSQSLTLQVEPKVAECFYEQVPVNTEMTLYYQVVRGGLLDIKLTVESPSGQLLYETLHFEEEDDGIYDFIPKEQGHYKFCFSNEMSRWTAKVVSFYLIKDEDEEPSKPLPASTEDLDPVENSIHKLSTEMGILLRHQHFFRGREAQHREIIETTTTRIVWVTLLESIVLIGMNLGQIYYLRRAFEVRGKVAI